MPQQLREDSSKIFLHDEYVHIVLTHEYLLTAKKDPFEDDVQLSLLVEDVQICTCGDLVTAFALMFAAYYIYNLSYLMR